LGKFRGAEYAAGECEDWDVLVDDLQRVLRKGKLTVEGDGCNCKQIYG
jgi:hypothetical protein